MKWGRYAYGGWRWMDWGPGPRTCDRCPAFLFAAESLRVGLCHGCRSPKAAFVVDGCTNPKIGEAEDTQGEG